MKISAKNISLLTGVAVIAAAGTVAVCIVASLPEECNAPEKVVHVSIDDCWKALADLSEPNVKSVYDVAFFKRLREWNERFGAKFTCYVYGCVESSGKNFDIANVPEKFKAEFQNAADWLKFGFHAPTSKIEETKKQTAPAFEKNLTRINASIDRFAGNASRTDVLRLDYFFAEADWAPALLNAKTRILLGPDTDGRAAYSLTESQSAALRERGFLDEEMGGGDTIRANRCSLRTNGFPVVDTFESAKSGTHRRFHTRMGDGKARQIFHGTSILLVSRTQLQIHFLRKLK